MKKFFLVISLLFTMALVGCSANTGHDDSRPLVYASFYPIEDLVREVAGDTVNLKSFLARGQDPHLWEPSPKDMREISKADVLFVNGANMEPWLPKLEESLPDLKIVNLSESVDLITYKGAAALGDFQCMYKLNYEAGETYPLEFGHTHENLMRIAFIKDKGQGRDGIIKEAKEIMSGKGQVITQRSHIDVEEASVYAIEMGHESGLVTYSLPEDGNWYFVSDRLSEDILSYRILDGGGEEMDKEIILEGSSSSLDKISYDPHSWLSIVNAKSYLIRINDELKKLYPENKRLYDKNKVKAVGSLTDLEYEYKEKFKEKRLAEFVSVHNAYSYLARDFGLKQFALSDLVSTEAPSLKSVRTALSFCQTHGVNTIFFESGSGGKSAQALAEDLGAEFKPLVSMEHMDGLKTFEDESYISIMRYNLEEIYKAVK